MEQEELMKSSFDSNIGTIGSNNNTSSIDESLKEIISKLDEINNTIKGVYNIEEKNEPVIESSNEVELPVEEQPAVVEEPVVEEAAPVEETPIVSLEEPVIENINIDPVVEETPTEDTFSPVEAPVSIEEPKVEENNNVISMDELLSSMNEVSDKPVEEQKDAVTPLAYEEPKVEVPAVETTPTLETVTPVAEEIKPVDVTPVVEEPKVEAPAVETTPTLETVTPVAEEIKPVEVAPMVEEPKVEAPAVETTPTLETVTPVAEEQKPVEVAPMVEEPKVEAPINNKYSDVTPLYVGMAEVKTGNDPHRVIAIVDNNVFNKKQSEEKALIMNKIA